MTQTDGAKALLVKLTDLQHVKPYAGWNIKGLKPLREEVIEFLKDAPAEDLEVMYLQRFVNCYREVKSMTRQSFTWVITELNVLTDEVRDHLGLPSIASLNPELKAMQDAVAGKGILHTRLSRKIRGTDGDLKFSYPFERG